MKEYNQGDSYEEFTGDDGLPLEFVEGEEDTTAKIQQIWGIPIKYMVFGGVGLFIVLLGILLVSLRKPAADPVDEVENWEQVEIPADNALSEDAYMPDDSFMPDVPLEGSEPVVDLSELTSEEQLKLRKLGYTGDEIALALNNGFDVEGLIEHATELHDAEAKEALERMSDAASDEFRYLLEYSYFGQPGYEFVDYSTGEYGSYVYGIDSFVINADYVKCPTYGAQLQLKCRVAEDLEVFYIVTPERFAELPETGNIVLSVEYTTYGENIYVTNIFETDNTLDSIDSSNISTSEIISENQSQSE